MENSVIVEALADLQALQYESGAVGMAMIALVKTHPDRAAFARELRLLAGDLQVVASADGAQMPQPTRSLLSLLLRIAEG